MEMAFVLWHANFKWVSCVRTERLVLTPKDMESANNSGEAVGRDRTSSTFEIRETTASVVNPSKEK